MNKFQKLIIAIFLISCLYFTIPAAGTTVSFTYDNIYRLAGVEEVTGSIVFTYTYDAVGNRLSVTTQGLDQLDTPDIADSGLYGFDDTSLIVDLTAYDRRYGNLDYEFAIGSSPGATDILDWTTYPVGSDGTAILDGLNLPFNQEYFVTVRIKNFAGEIVTPLVSTDGLTVLDPVADPDGDGFDNQSEVSASSDPLNEFSFPADTSFVLRPGMNLISIPAEISYANHLSAWIPVLGEAQVDKVLYLDPDTGKFIVLIPGEIPAEDPILMGAEGLIVYATGLKTVNFDTVLCAYPILQPGFNLIGVPCPPEGYTAFDLLQDYGSETVTSIKRFSAEEGAYETAGFDQNGQLMGIDFPIIRGEGYILFVK